MEDEEGLWVAEGTFLCWGKGKQGGKGAGIAGEIRAGIIESL